jgi:hypothetical protein
MPNNSSNPSQDDDQWTKLFAYLEERFDGVHAEIQDVRDEVNGLRNTLDGIANRLDHDDTERTAMSSKLDRHGRWITQLADHSQVKLEPQA